MTAYPEREFAPLNVTRSKLSPRELEIVALIHEDLTNPEIAERLGISRKTVESHIGNIRLVLGKDRVGIALWWERRKAMA